MSKAKSALWVIPVIALVGVIAGAYWFGLRPQLADDTIAENVASGPQVPDLGSRGKPVETPANEPAPDDGVATDGAAADGGEVEPETEAANSAREIDIWLSNLAIATKAGDRKGIALNHEMLAKAKPDALVDERVRNALDNENSAWVRMQFFLAYHDAKAKFDWAMHVYDTRTAKFMGTDDLYVGGEIEELKLIARELFGKLVAGWQADGTGDFRLMALLRNAIETEKPDWLLGQVLEHILLSVVEMRLRNLAQVIEQEMRACLLRRTADRYFRELLLCAFILTFEPESAILEELARAEWWDYASALAAAYPARLRLSANVLKLAGGNPDWIDSLIATGEIPKLFEQLLQGLMPVEDKRLLIQRISMFEIPNGRAMIEAGLARKDANYADYLTAFGSLAESGEELQRLTTAADEPDVAAAQGAIEGLRQSALREADAELRKVLENGSNPGVKSQALGALLSRAANTDKLLEEYLDESKDASLRAVAAQHVPLTSVERLQRIVEEDPSPSVRIAALNRVGSIVPSSVFQKKELHGWFVKIKDRDNSTTIRAAARKYAEGLQE